MWLWRGMVLGGRGKLYRLVSSSEAFEKIDCVSNAIEFAPELGGACWIIEKRLKSQSRAIRLRWVSGPRRREGTDGAKPSSRSSSISSRRSSVRKVEKTLWLLFDLSFRVGGRGGWGNRFDDFGGLPKSRTGRNDAGSDISMGSGRAASEASKKKGQHTHRSSNNKSTHIVTYSSS